MVTWTYVEEEVPEGVRGEYRTFQHRLIGENVTWPMRQTLDAYLTHHFGPKHDRWRLKYVRYSETYIPGVRQHMWYNAVLRFASREDAMMFKLGWPY